MSDNFREFKSQGEENYSEQTKKSGNARKNQGKTIVSIVIAILFVGIVAFESVYSIKEQEQGVVTTFGKAGSVVTSGLHFKIPFIQKVTKVNTTILGFPIGYNPSGSQEVSEEEAAAESLMITSDFNFVNVDFYVEYKVSDPVKYLYNSKQPTEILKNIAQSCIRTVVSNFTVDDVITTGKSEIQAEIKEMIVQKLEQQDIGLMLVNISMQDAADKLGMPKDTLYGWVKAYRRKLRAGEGEPIKGNLTDDEKEIIRLKRELKDTKDALEILKKAISILGD